MRIIILDTETTGLDPSNGHRIIEIGCIEVINMEKTGRVFHHYINPERDVPEESYRITGIATEFLYDKPKFAEIANDFLDFIEGGTLVIHNAQFDVNFINSELSRLALPTINIKKNVIDTLAMARKKFPGAPASLNALCKKFNVDLSKRDKHGALLDSELLFDVYVNLMGGKQVSLGLEASVKKVSLVEAGYVKESVMASISTKEFRAPREHNPTEEELKRHQEFIAKIKEAIWSN
jgi:DNA polymerase-3 subunit epsilon